MEKEKSTLYDVYQMESVPWRGDRYHGDPDHFLLFHPVFPGPSGENWNTNAVQLR